MDATGQRPIKLPRYVVLSFYIVFSWWRCGLQRCWLRSTVRVACPEGHTLQRVVRLYHLVDRAIALNRAGSGVL
jgi:hypothetical protein